MADVKLKDLTGTTHNYNDVKSIAIPSAEGNDVEIFYQPDFQTKTVTPGVTQQEIDPDEGYDALTRVTVNAIPYQAVSNLAGGKTVTIG